MGTLFNQIHRTLLPGMSIPEPLRLLFDWIEQRKTYVDRDAGRIGFLFPEEAMKKGWTDSGRPGGTDVSFMPEGNVNMKYWFRHERPEMLNRLCVFCQTGGDGSMAAFWLDPDGGQKIVHLGSGSGSTLVCVLADDAVDFLRLLAIGYDEICWSEAFDSPPNSDSDFIVQPNTEFQNWVKSTFSVSIPTTAREIVRHPSKMGDEDSLDPFNRWVASMTK
jgi:hypothetical protein